LILLIPAFDKGGFRSGTNYGQLLRRPSSGQNGPRVKPGVTEEEGETELGLTGTEATRIRPAPFRHSGLDPESMFIGTRRRKTLRKGAKCLSNLRLPIHWPSAAKRLPAALSHGSNRLKGRRRQHCQPVAVAAPAIQRVADVGASASD
jgi:hypothetical protein